MRQLWNLNPHIPNDSQGKQSVGVLWMEIPPGGGYPGISVRIDVFPGNTQIWFSRVTCTGLSSWSGCNSQIQIRDQNSLPITPENGDESLLRTPFCIFTSLFKSSLMSSSSSLQRNPCPTESFYTCSDSICVLALFLWLWERPRLIPAMADVIPHHNKSPMHHLHHNWRVSQCFPFHELWVLSSYALNVLYLWWYLWLSAETKQSWERSLQEELRAFPRSSPTHCQLLKELESLLTLSHCWSP